MRTRLSICAKKRSYRSQEEALLAARRSELDLRTYRCDRCWLIHLTSRTKGKFSSRRVEADTADAMTQPQSPPEQ